MSTLRPTKVVSRRTALAGLAAGGIGLGLQSGLVRAHAQTADDITQETGVVYGTVDDQELMLDIASPPPITGALRPAVILIHGGGMHDGSRTDLSLIQTPLAQAGYVIFSIDYRLFDLTKGTNP